MKVEYWECTHCPSACNWATYDQAVRCMTMPCEWAGDIDKYLIFIQKLGRTTP